MPHSNCGPPLVLMSTGKVKWCMRSSDLQCLWKQRQKASTWAQNNLYHMVTKYISACMSLRQIYDIILYFSIWSCDKKGTLLIFLTLPLCPQNCMFVLMITHRRIFFLTEHETYMDPAEGITAPAQSLITQRGLISVTGCFLSCCPQFLQKNESVLLRHTNLKYVGYW